MKNKNIIFSVVIIFLLMIIGSFVIFKTPEDVSLRENRVLAKFHKPSIEKIYKGEFQNNFEEAFSDQFVFKSNLYDYYSKINNSLRNVANRFLDDNNMMLVSISDTGIYSIGVGGDWLTEFPWFWSKNYDQMFGDRIENYDRLIAEFPNIDFYIYKATNCRDTDWFDEANGIQSSGGFYENNFIDWVDSRYIYKSGYYESFEEYKKYNYKTDHHWNADGARKGYIDIINMIKEKYPQIGEPKEPVDKKTSNVKFYGSLAKTSNYNVKNTNYDLISDYFYNLNNYDLYINGEKVEKYGLKDEYFNNVVDNNKEINHYRECFGPDTFEKKYDFGNNTGLNLLVIADSYSNCIEPVLASHFDTTIFYDLRYKEQRTFDIKDVIKNNNIDIVMFMGGYFDIFMEEAYIIPLD